VASGEAFFEAAPTLLVLCLRILLRRQAREGAAQGLDGRATTTGQPLRGLVPRGDDEWRADYGDICSLLPHVEDLPKETIEEYLRYCVVARAYVEHRANRAREEEKEEEEQRRQKGGGGENDVQTKNESDGEDDVRMGKWMDIRLLFRHLCQTHTNVYAIYEVADDDEHGGGTKPIVRSCSGLTPVLLTRRWWWWMQSCSGESLRPCTPPGACSTTPAVPTLCSTTRAES
jgi:hypothetical protein